MAALLDECLFLIVPVRWGRVGGVDGRERRRVGGMDGRERRWAGGMDKAEKQEGALGGRERWVGLVE